VSETLTKAIIKHSYEDISLILKKHNRKTNTPTPYKGNGVLAIILLISGEVLRLKQLALPNIFR
tara:strand:- start:1048 stop:1239 length:192 start_codon:yes stop_codon:yes gene_type:complete